MEEIMPVNKGFVLASRPPAGGQATRENFGWFEEEIGEPGPDEVLVRHAFLSLDPYMRGRMDDSRSYARAQEVGQPMIGGTVGEVVASHNPRFAVGDKVVGMGGWRLYALSDGTMLQKVDASRVPLQAYLGALGMPGITAWIGMNRILAPKAGETIVVSAATGAVGSVVGQLAVAAGARAVGIAGGAEKCAYARDVLGYDACLDRHSSTFDADLKAAAPNGIDGLFENAGGRIFDACLRRLNDFARIAICGLIASYQGEETTALPDLRLVLVRRLRIEGLIVFDRMDLWPRALADLTGLYANGKLKWRESVADGIESAPQAFLDLLAGRNFGKQLVRLP
jgi:NADPH-dependent curcumin reductase CurA